MSQVSCPVCSGLKLCNISPSLLECTSCTVVINTAYKALPYDNTYFLEEYKNQYGHTYIEDYAHIYALAKKRLSHIAALMGCDLHFNWSREQRKMSLKPLALLDIGSAMGFFLKCAKDMGISSVKGLEISDYAARYCQQEFGIDVINRPYTHSELIENYDIITSWFFIEHCLDSVDIIKDIYAALPKGGVFAFSVPSITGPSYTFHREAWIAEHPVDHALDFSPYAVKKLLKKIGFKKIKVLPAGFHPERIIQQHSLFYRPFVCFYKLYTKMTAFSDTIEVYAQK